MNVWSIFPVAFSYWKMVIIVRKWQKSNFYFDTDLGNSLLATMKIRKEKKKPNNTHTQPELDSAAEGSNCSPTHFRHKGQHTQPIGQGVSNC